MLDLTELQRLLRKSDEERCTVPRFVISQCQPSEKGTVQDW